MYLSLLEIETVLDETIQKIYFPDHSVIILKHIPKKGEHLTQIMRKFFLTYQLCLKYEAIFSKYSGKLCNALLF